MDGNNSAKRLAAAGHADKRVFKSDFFLTPDEVDVFRHEVKARKTQPAATSNDEGEPLDAPWLRTDGPGDVTDGQDSKTSCAEHWKASAADHEKRALDVHEQTGIFAAACRHGTVLLVAEMLQSGEL